MSVKILAYHKVGIPFDLSFCWHDRYAFLRHLAFFKQNGLGMVTVAEAIDYGRENDLALTFDDGFAPLFDFRDEFIASQARVTIYPITAYIGCYDRWEVSLGGLSFKHLDGVQIRKLSDDGHQIGSHTHTHRALTGISKAELIRELTVSKKIIEDLTSRSCDSISLPFGRINQQVVDECYACGYHNIVSTSKFTSDSTVLQARVVYGLDGNYLLKAKLGLNGGQWLEDIRLRLFSLAAGCTITAQKALDRLNLK